MTGAPHLIVLAAGSSRRFGEENKLVAQLNGKPVAAYSAELWLHMPVSKRVVVVSEASSNISDIYRSANWTTIENPDAESGQSSSIRTGVQYAVKDNAEGVIICLADMPFVGDKHLNLVSTALLHHDAVLSSSADADHPPAGFTRSAFSKLCSLQGDQGAKQVFYAIRKRTKVAFEDQAMMDIDTKEALMCAEKLRSANA